MSDFKSYKVDMDDGTIILKRIRHNDTYGHPLFYSRTSAKEHMLVGTFECLPDNIQEDIKSAIELLDA